MPGALPNTPLMKWEGDLLVLFLGLGLSIGPPGNFSADALAESPHITIK